MYDNAVSGLEATNLQDAIDEEVAARKALESPVVITAARTAADRAIDKLHIEEFRGLGGDNSDTTAIKEAVSYMRDQTLANSMRRHFLTGANHITYEIEDSIDATNITARFGWGIRDINFFGACPNKPVWDFSGSRYGKFSNMNGYLDDGAPPSAAFLFSRIGATGPAAGNNRLWGCDVRGSATKGILVNRASEVSSVIGCYFLQHFSYVDDESPGFVAVYDGNASVLISSQYQELYASAAAFNLSSIYSSSFVKNAAVTGDCVYLSRFVNWRAMGSYFVSNDGAHYRIALSGLDRRFHSDSHHEGTATHLARFMGSGSPTISGFTLRDHSAAATTAALTVDSGLTKVTIDDAVIELDTWSDTSSNGLTDTPSKLELVRPTILLPNNVDLGNLEGYAGLTSHRLAAKDNGSVITGRTLKKISRSIGTAIGNATAGGGLAGAFNGTTDEVSGSGASKTSATSMYVGKTFNTPKIFGRAVVFGARNHEFVVSADPNVTITVYGKTGTAPASETDGTVIGTLGPFADTAPNPCLPRILESTDLLNEWVHIWVRIVQDGVAATMCCAELVLYEWA